MTWKQRTHLYNGLFFKNWRTSRRRRDKRWNPGPFLKRWRKQVRDHLKVPTLPTPQVPTSLRKDAAVQTSNRALRCFIITLFCKFISCWMSTNKCVFFFSMLFVFAAFFFFVVRVLISLFVYSPGLPSVLSTCFVEIYLKSHQISYSCQKWSFSGSYVTDILVIVCHCLRWARLSLGGFREA